MAHREQGAAPAAPDRVAMVIGDAVAARLRTLYEAVAPAAQPPEAMRALLARLDRR
ncbi:hypothetical protein ACFFJB_02515 [Camelimonas abortus]|uniref:Anti-sigma factor NepR domain-containing protein n=1 Tax=Camelimonas abortus TaxID=1017184 RepID=A0ABV7LHK3_9HYPH